MRNQNNGQSTIQVFSHYGLVDDDYFEFDLAGALKWNVQILEIIKFNSVRKEKEKKKT